MSNNNQLRLKVKVSKFLTQIWQSDNLVSNNVALAALGYCTIQGNQPFEQASGNSEITLSLIVLKKYLYYGAHLKIYFGLKFILIKVFYY